MLLRYGDPRLQPQRLGQQAFKGVVLDAYGHRCTITGAADIALDRFARSRRRMFIAYFVAERNLRWQFSMSGRTNPFDQISELLYQRCVANPDTDWWMVSRVYAVPEVLGRLSAEEHVALLGRWSALIRDALPASRQDSRYPQADRPYRVGTCRIGASQMLEIEKFDLDEIANALADQNMFDEHRLLVNPETGAIVLWTRDGGIDGTNPVDLDELDLIVIESLPSYVWYRDMADFVELVSDDSAVRRLARAINGREAFRRFKDELYEEYPHLLPAWHAFRDARALRRAVQWVHDKSLISDEAADRFRTEHPDPDVP